MNATNAQSRILTTTVGSYPLPDWLAALPSEQAILDATRVVIDTQEQAGIDLVCDGELYRFDVNHPETSGMIEYFVRPLAGVRPEVGLANGSHSRRRPAWNFAPSRRVLSTVQSGRDRSICRQHARVPRASRTALSNSH